MTGFTASSSVASQALAKIFVLRDHLRTLIHVCIEAVVSVAVGDQQGLIVECFDKPDGIAPRANINGSIGQLGPNSNKRRPFNKRAGVLINMIKAFLERDIMCRGKRTAKIRFIFDKVSAVQSGR